LNQIWNDIKRNNSYNNKTLVGDSELCSTTREFNLLVNVIAAIFGLSIMFGNTLVLIVLFKFPCKKFVPINWLLCHLALSDFIMGGTVFFWYGIAEITQIPVKNEAKTIAYGAAITAIISSLAGLMMISFDRYLLLFYNTSYIKIISKKRLSSILAIMWIIPIVIFIIIPAVGWSCIKECDCRIHNIAPDEVYCFHDSCSQIFPPLTKLEMLVTSLLFMILFTITIILYVVMFYKVWDKLKGLRYLRSSSPSFPSSTDSTNTVAINDRTESRINLSQSPDLSDISAINFEANSIDEKSVTSNLTATNTANLIVASEANCSNWKNNRKASDSLNVPLSTSTKGDNQAIEYIRNDRLKIPNASPISVNKKINVRTRQRGSKGSRTRKRELELMMSMFIVIAVFVVTTSPSIIFLLYTYFNNDRGIKEVGNILLQITTINSLLNPFVYFWRIKSMRRNLFKLFSCTFQGISTSSMISKLSLRNSLKLGDPRKSIEKIECKIEM